MTSLVPLIVVLIILAVASELLRTQKGAKAKGKSARAVAVPVVYESCGGLLTNAEKSFFGVLRQIFGNEAHISCKVRLADIIKPRNAGQDWQASFNRISPKHVDFVLCDPSTLSVWCCIELNESRALPKTMSLMFEAPPRCFI